MKPFCLSLLIVLFRISAFATSESTNVNSHQQSFGNYFDSAVLLLDSNLSCVSNADCLQIPIGVRACGGPETYILTSIKNKHIESAKALINIGNDLQRNQMKSQGIGGLCSISVPNPVACENLICTEK